MNRSINTSEGVSETVQYFLDRLYTNRYPANYHLQPWEEEFLLSTANHSGSQSTCWYRTTMHFLEKLKRWQVQFKKIHYTFCSHWPHRKILIHQVWLGRLTRRATSSMWPKMLMMPRPACVTVSKTLNTNDMLAQIWLYMHSHTFCFQLNTLTTRSWKPVHLTQAISIPTHR